MGSRFLWIISCPKGADVGETAPGSISLLGGAVEKRHGWPRIMLLAHLLGGGMNNNKYIVLIVI